MKKGLALIAVFFFGAFFYGHHASAYTTLYSQTSGSTSKSTVNASYGLLPTPLTASSTMTAATLWLKQGTITTGTFAMEVLCSDGQFFDSIAHNVSELNPNTFTPIQFIFGHDCSGTNIAAGITNIGNAIGDSYIETENSSPFFPNIILYGGVPEITNINFSAGFYNNMTVPDFSVWQVDLTFPDQTFNASWEIEYKNASSTRYNYFDRFGINGYNSGAFNQTTSSFKKHTALTPGNYVAQAVLFVNNNPMSLSPVLNFTITSGTPIQTPGLFPVPTTTVQGFMNSTSTGGNELSPAGMCTNFSYSILGADFGNWACNVFAFVLVPGQDTVNAFSELQGTMQTHAPFSYFYDTINAIQNLNPSTTPMSGLTLTIGATSSPIHFSVDVFSSSTIEKYTSPTARSVLRTLMQWTLYIGFIAMVILEVRHLFRGKGTEK